jgi:hypothetical protein
LRKDGIDLRDQPFFLGLWRWVKPKNGIGTAHGVAFSLALCVYAIFRQNGQQRGPESDAS